jgi:hypothetical protein
MTKFIIPALAGTLFLGGCAELVRNTPPSVSTAQNEASIIVRPQVLSGGYRNQAVPKLTAAQINHLTIQIFELNGVQEAPVLDATGKPVLQDLAKNQLATLLTFSKLKPQTTYRIRAYAYDAPGTLAENLISTTDAGSYVDVAVLEDDRPTSALLKVTLKDVDFDGQGSFQGVTVISGGYHSKGPVTITIGGALLNEGAPAEQGMLDIYRPNFAAGMTWTYEVVTTRGAVQSTATLTQEISNVTPDDFTLTETTTPSDDPLNPKTTVKQMTAAGWFPPAAGLKDMGYVTLTLGEVTYAGELTKFAAATNTTTDHTYYWITAQKGLIQKVSTFPSEQGQTTVRQSLVSFTSP